MYSHLDYAAIIRNIPGIGYLFKDIMISKIKSKWKTYAQTSMLMKSNTRF